MYNFTKHFGKIFHENIRLPFHRRTSGDTSGDISLCNSRKLRHYAFLYIFDEYNLKDICKDCLSLMPDKEVRELKHYLIVKKLKS